MIRFFVVGTGRCGTTMLRAVLNLHPQIYIPTETHWIPAQYEFYGGLRNPPDDYIDIMKRTFFNDGRLTVDVLADEIGSSTGVLLEAVRSRLGSCEPTLVEFNDALFATIAAFRGRIFAGDKTPAYSNYLPLLRSLWPRGKFVHIIRDGRDVALSMSHHAGFRRTLSSRARSWAPLSLDKRYEITFSADDSHSLEDFIRLWDIRVRRTLNDASRFPPEAYFEMRYEQLVREPAEHLRRLVEFLEMPLDDEWLLNAAQVIRPDRVNNVTEQALYESLTATAQSTLASLGYDTSSKRDADPKTTSVPPADSSLTEL